MITVGGKALLQAMLAQAKSLEWEGIGSYHDGYQTPDTGRSVVLYYDYLGVSCSSLLNYYGRSVGVAPEALRARSADAKKLLLETKVY